MTRLLLSILLMLVSVLMPQVLGQQKNDPGSDNVTEARVSSPVSVIFGHKRDGFPETLKVRGVISEMSFSRGCGVVLWSGTLKIKLIDRIEGYPYEHVFVVVNCLEDSQNEKRYLNKVVEMEASKLYPKYRKFSGVDTFYFELIDNTIDSGGVPFYCTNMWRDEILKNIEHRAN
jgi:hypothetical protein